MSSIIIGSKNCIMESLPEQGYLKFYSDTMTYLRKQYNLDHRGVMDKVIDNLEDWLKKQNHFIVKIFPRSYLERQIILNKGSVERAKRQIECLFTMKTVVTSLLGKYDVKNDFEGLREVLSQTLMPRLTKDHYRVYAAQVLSNDICDAEMLSKYYSFSINIFEYIRSNEYCNGIVVVYDVRVVHIMDLVSQINLIKLNELIRYILEGYQIRLKGIHFISTSTTIDVLVKILKKMLSEKIGQRIYVHRDMESLHEHIPKDYLPKEFGGDQNCLSTLCDEFIEDLGSKENVEYLKEMGKAVVDESLRVGELKDSRMLGITGSFRTISID